VPTFLPVCRESADADKAQRFRNTPIEDYYSTIRDPEKAVDYPHGI
jgi:hypothetical protein